MATNIGENRPFWALLVTMLLLRLGLKGAPAGVFRGFDLGKKGVEFAGFCRQASSIQVNHQHD